MARLLSKYCTNCIIVRGIVHVIGLVFAVYAWVYVYGTLFEIRLIGLGHTRIFLPNSPSASVVFASILSFPPLEL